MLYLVLIERTGREHAVLVDSERHATDLLDALGFVSDVVPGSYYLPLGQPNPGRIEWAKVLRR